MKNLYANFFVMLGFVLAFSLKVSAQDMEVTGKVTAAEDGSGLPGVNVLIVGTTGGAVSDINGDYKLKAGVGAVLEFRFLGYTTERRTVTAETGVINVVLTEETKALKEAVVIGYGTVKKKDLTGSVTSIGSQDFQKGFQPTADQLIAGKAAGVQIVSNGGAPGSGSTIRIRGGTSLNASNDPLIVIDGVPVDNNGLSGSPNTLSLINPNDIENITILKDASAAAIYGSRAANGVILITTKKGGPGLVNVQFSSQNSVQQMTRFVNVLSGDEFRAYIKANGNGKDSLLGPEGVNTDWQREIMRMAYTSDNNLSVGGTLALPGMNLPYRLSGGYLSQQSVLKTGYMDRFSGGVNLSPTFFNNRLQVNLNLKHSYTKNRFADAGALGAAIGFDPTQPIKNGSRYGGYFEWTDSDGSLQAIRPANPLAMIELRDDVSEITRSIGNAQFDYRLHFFPDVRINYNIGFDRSEANGNNNISPMAASSYNVGGSKTAYHQRKHQYISETYLNYTKEFAVVKSRVDLTVGHSFQDFRTVLYANPTFNYKDSVLTPAFRLGSPPVNVIESYFGRLNYTLNNKYLLTVTVRRDGSSRFAPAYRWGWFPSTALAWKLNEETFLKNIKMLNNLKIRVGYGVTGQQDVNSDYGYYGGYQLGQVTAMYQFGDTSFYRMYKPLEFQGDLRWEKTASYNAGLDFGFFNDRLSGAVDVFYRETTDLLNNTNISAGSNFANKIIANVGNMESKGVEVSVNAGIIRKEKLTWDVGFNFTHFQNKITKISINKDSIKLDQVLVGPDLGDQSKVQINTIGQTPQAFYLYEQVYRDGKPVFNEYVDQNGDGKITSADRIAYKSPVPKFLMGLTTNVTYGKLTFGMVWRASYGNYMYNAVEATRGHQAAMLPSFPHLSNGSSNVLFTDFESKQLFSTYYVQDASFIRCDNINFGYNLGNKVHKALNIQFNLNIQNAILITKYTGVDPEVNGGVDQAFFARPKVYVLGVNIGFNHTK